MTRCTITCAFVFSNKKKQNQSVDLEWDGTTITNIPPPNLTPREHQQLCYAVRTLIKISKMKEG